MRRRFALDLALQPPEVRRAGSGDAEAMARVSIDTWRLAYAGLLPGVFLDGLRLDEQTAQRGRLLDGPGSVHFIAEEPFTGEAVAFASCGSARGRAEAGVGEVFELYVQHGFQRHGLGRSLMAASVEWLARQGHHGLLVRVLADNPARAFYERLGGKAAGLRTIRVGGALVEEAAYRWSDQALAGRFQES